jgi:hypothetical protein
MLKSELEDARAAISEMESLLASLHDGSGANNASSRRPSYFASYPGGDLSTPNSQVGEASEGGVSRRRKSLVVKDAMYDADLPTKVQVDTSELLDLENQLGIMEQELIMSKDRTSSVEMLEISSRQRVLEIEAAEKQVRSELEQLRVEMAVNRSSMRQALSSAARKEEQLQEDQDIIILLRSRVSELEDELTAAGGDPLDSRSRFSSRADVVLDEVREHSESMMSAMSFGQEVDPATSAADTELQERLVAKLQQSTTQLMQAQTELNSAENELQSYKRKYHEWMEHSKPEFTVEGLVDPSRGFVLYKVVLFQKNVEHHHFEHRYSEFDRFRAHLKRVLFVQDDTGVRLPALPPKVWGNSRSQSGAVVEQRKQGITVFLNVMLALSELSVPVRTEFFDWIDWHPTQETGKK